MRCSRGLAALLLASACGGGASGPADAPSGVDAEGLDAPLDAGDGGLLQTLAETGLCVDAACTQITPGILP